MQPVNWRNSTDWLLFKPVQRGSFRFFTCGTSALIYGTVVLVFAVLTLRLGSPHDEREPGSTCALLPVDCPTPVTSQTAQHSVVLTHSNSPLQLLDRHGDLEVMSQNVKGSEDVCPLDHLSQRTPLEHFGAENISRLFRQEAYVDQDLGKEDRDTLKFK